MDVLTIILLIVLVYCVNSTTLPRRQPNLGTTTCSGIRKNNFYSYDRGSPIGPRQWWRCYDECNGPHQSPIDIRLRTVRCMGSGEEEIPGFLWYKSPKGYARGSFVNNGHTSTFSLLNHGNVRTYGKVLRNVPHEEDTDYVFSELHFHIGANGSRTGSEHRINGKGFRGEIHMVHWKRTREMRTYVEGSRANDGVVAIGIFFNVVRRCHTEADRLILNYVSHTRKYLAVKEPAFVNPSLLLPADGRYFTYEGSKTTPPCNTNVRWIVYKTPTTICYRSYRVLMGLQVAEVGHPFLRMFGNDRPIQNNGIYNVQGNFLRCD
ncbi:carbonic anhydrase 7-like [Ylistrum balloti]|uniref:carbonic anhydrase 7-like n=1 Tax=Ylistrum balloti TaxID=509963 RepID=UPI002905F1FA|nr:carbonic anhydrase 7-like [Ylistrum balloti]